MVRPRDATIDAAVLEAALEELRTQGYAGFSLSAVATRAGTTRPALYRRWSGKEALVIDAVAHLADTAAPERTGDTFADLVAELEDFRHCICEAAALPLAGLVMGGELDAGVVAAYRERVVAPRRSRLRGLLEEGVATGALDADADLAVAGGLLTGSWYALALAGAAPPDDWATRAARLVWRACGGSPPA